MLKTLLQDTDELISAHNLMLWACDLDGNMLYRNDFFAKQLTNVHKRKFEIGDNLLDLDITEQDKIFWGDVYKSYYDEVVIKELKGATTEDGTYALFKIIIKSLVDNNVHYGNLILLDDISERVHKYNKLENNINILKQFIYVITHDIKNPIRQIFASFDLFLEEKDQKQQLELVNMIKDTLSTMNTLINDTLKFVMTIEDSNEEDLLISEIVDTIMKDYALDNVELKLELDGGLFSFDRMQINQVISNLISNAIKYNDKEKKEIKMGLIYEGEYRIGFYIEDNGNGIDLKYKDKIFQLFQRLDVSKEGSGVGLALVKNFCDSTGYNIEMESEVGKGTKISIYNKKNVQKPYYINSR